jgi:hypothetical protein
MICFFCPIWFLFVLLLYVFFYLFYDLICFFNSIHYHLFYLVSKSSLVFILFIDVWFFFIIFLIKFCFQFHPLAFNFHLFLCQIRCSFFYCYFFILDYFLLYVFFNSSLDILLIKNFVSPCFRVCLL